MKLAVVNFIVEQIVREMLAETALKLAAPGKGILASDESTGTIGKRLEKAGLQNDEVSMTHSQFCIRHRGLLPLPV
jgi:fructose-bisphosphate aldolase class 1